MVIVSLTVLTIVVRFLVFRDSSQFISLLFSSNFLIAARGLTALAVNSLVSKNKKYLGPNLIYIIIIMCK